MGIKFEKGHHDLAKTRTDLHVQMDRSCMPIGDCICGTYGKLIFYCVSVVTWHKFRGLMMVNCILPCLSEDGIMWTEMQQQNRGMEKLTVKSWQASFV